ncbi:MAG: peptide deformylase [Acetivibrionales bacterium]|jgi:peptide deformylase|nr:peptide deformylase [Clostridiaceae bacterium]
MALRTIIKKGDEVLNKRCKEVKEINERIIELLDDMKETMYESSGVGLAAPQVGVLKRVVVMDVGEDYLELINPVIIASEGEQNEAEGCLSLPGIYGIVKRPKKVVVEYLDRNGNEMRVEGEDLKAICLCHEIDHLNGILFDEKVTEFIELEKE